MTTPERVSPAAARQQAKRRGSLVAAYRDGLGFTAIIVWSAPEGIRITVPGSADVTPAPAARWWCRHAADAASVAAAATRLFKRRQSQDGSGLTPGTALSNALVRAGQAIAAAAARAGVRLYADEDIAREAAEAVARVDAEFERLQRSGDLKAVNRSYRDYRMAAALHGEKIMPYARWLDKYREDFVRKLAAGSR